MKHQYRLKVIEEHLDRFGHMNNATYLSVLEDARWAMIQERGYDQELINESGIGPIILEIHIKFRREMRLNDEVIIESQVVKQDRRFGVVHQEIKSLDGSEVKAIADVTVGLFDTRTRKLVPPTAEWLAAIGWDKPI